MLGLSIQPANCHCIACATIEQGREELHDPRVRIERGEWFTIRCAPLARAKAFCVEVN
ncbi:hypothetical protein [Methylobacter luteus]|uniref:hypothetical protein n=1 Tax=Methylobacter luteus TaxID=415 RepID=UPI0003F82922|nr:hypothetical protein [Methylobacter luteus]